MKNYVFTMILVSALVVSVAVIRQKAQAQNTSPQPKDKTSPTIADAVGETKSQEPIFVTEIPAGYRDWKVVSVAHEAGDLNDIRAILANDIAIKAYREGKLPFPEGAIVGR